MALGCAQLELFKIDDVTRAWQGKRKLGIWQGGLSDTLGMLRWVLVGLLPVLMASCSEFKPTTITNGAWKFDERTGKLTCNGAEVPNLLCKYKLSLVTPLGKLAPQSDGTWFRYNCQFPLPDPARQWVPMLLQCGSENCGAKILKAGFYATHRLRAGSPTWQDTQLYNTPASWIYVFREQNGMERGCWVAPNKLGELDWESVLEGTQTAQSNERSIL